VLQSLLVSQWHGTVYVTVWVAQSHVEFVQWPYIWPLRTVPFDGHVPPMHSLIWFMAHAWSGPLIAMPVMAAMIKSLFMILYPFVFVKQKPPSLGGREVQKS